MSYSFKPITQLRVQIYDQTGGKLLPHIRTCLAAYKARWGESIADQLEVIYSPAEQTIGVPIIVASYQAHLVSQVGATLQINTIGELTHHNLRAMLIDPVVKSTDNLEEAMQWLNGSPDIIACDFETAPKLIKSEKQTLIDRGELTHDERLSTLAIGLSHPSLTVITHLSISITESESFVVILTDELRKPILDWLVTTERKQVWHNCMFDFTHIYYHTNKLPKNYEDSQLMWATILNHVRTLERKVGLKHLAAPIYRDWAVDSAYFELDEMYNSSLIKYAGIDSQATLYLYNEALLHPDFQVEHLADLITEVLPIDAPKDFNPGRRYFYNSVAKQLIPLAIRIKANGLPLDLTKVDTLRDKLDTVISAATEAINTNPLMLDFLAKECTASKAAFIKEHRAKIKSYEHYLKPLDYTSVEGRSYLMEHLIAIQMITATSPDTYLPNGHPKWTSNALKPHKAQPYVGPMLDKTLAKDDPVCMEAALKLAIDKSNLLKANQTLQTKLANADVLSKVLFNPNSTPQKQAFFEYVGLAPVAYSKDTGAPSWGRESLEDVVHTTSGDLQKVIQELLNLSEVKTTRTNFVENFTTYNIDGRVYPNLKLWGTLSFRPSGGGDRPGTKSGYINGLNQPASGSPQAGIIKDCFTAPVGKVLMASDLASLTIEDAA